MAAAARRRFEPGRLGALPAVTVVVGLAVLSLVGLIIRSLRPDAITGGRPGLDAWRRVLSDPELWAALVFTLRTAVLATAVSVALAVPLGLALRRVGTMARAAVAAPVPVPHLLMATVTVAWMAPGGLVDRLIGDPGVVGARSGTGVILVYALKEVPFLALLVLAAIDDGSAGLEEAAAGLGAGPLDRWRFVILPRLIAPLTVGSLVVAAFVVGSTEVPLVVGPIQPDVLTTYSLTVVELRGPAARADAAAALAVTSAVVGLLVAAAVGLLALRAMAHRRGWTAPPALDEQAARIRSRHRDRRDRTGPARRERRRPRRRVARNVVGLAAVTLVLPLLILPIQAIGDEWRAPALWPQRMGTRGLARVLADDAVPRAVVTSLVVALVAVTVALILSWPAARAIATAGGGGRWWLVAVAAPVLLPPLVVGEGLRVWLLRLGLADGLPGLVAAHLVFVVPYVTIVLVPAITDAIVEREQAAATLGAGRLDRFRLVTLPAAMPQLALASALGFTVSWSQYGTSLGVGGGRPLLPLILVPFVRSDPQIAAVLGLLFLLPPAAALSLAVRALPADRRRAGRPPRARGARGRGR